MATSVKLSFASLFVGFLFVMFVMSAFQMETVDALTGCIGKLQVVGPCANCAAQCDGIPRPPGVLTGHLCFSQAGISICGCCLQ